MLFFNLDLVNSNNSRNLPQKHKRVTILTTLKKKKKKKKIIKKTFSQPHPFQIIASLSFNFLYSGQIFESPLLTLKLEKSIHSLKKGVGVSMPCCCFVFLNLNKFILINMAIIFELTFPASISDVDKKLT